MGTSLHSYTGSCVVCMRVSSARPHCSSSEFCMSFREDHSLWVLVLVYRWARVAVLNFSSHNVQNLQFPELELSVPTRRMDCLPGMSTWLQSKVAQIVCVQCGMYCIAAALISGISIFAFVNVAILVFHWIFQNQCSLHCYCPNKALTVHTISAESG